MDLMQVRAATLQAYQRGGKPRIQECGERLVRVHASHAYSWYHHRMRLTNDPAVYLRATVYDMFKAARAELQSLGYDLKIYDGWRPVVLQEVLFWYYMERFTIKRLGLARHFAGCKTGEQIAAAFQELPPDVREKLRQENTQYVSWPSQDPKHPSPHATGGAVDVWLYEKGRPAELGVPFDWMQANAGAFHHLTGAGWHSGSAEVVRKNRETLLRAMLGAGFSAYPHEIWHFNYGNQMDALVTGQSARYGYITP